MPALFKGLIQKTSGYIVPLASILRPSFPLLLSLLNGTERGRGLEKEAKGIKELRYRNLLGIRTSGKLRLEFFPSTRSAILVRVRS